MADDLTTNAAGGDLGLAGAPVVPAAPPMSMAEAADRKAAFIADKVKTAALMNGDIKATAEWRLITNSLCQPPQVTAPRDELAAHLDAASGFQLSPEILAEVRANTPITTRERQATEALWNDRQRDPAWFARYQRGERTALKEKALIDFMLSRPIRDVPTT